MSLHSKKSPEIKKSVRIFWKFFLYAWVAGISLILIINFGVFGKLPSLEELENPSILSSSEIYADDGTLMGKYYLQDRINVDYKDISPYVTQALIATEDERFYDHSGIDVKSLFRAVAFLGSEGGASTITQQLAKALLGQQSSKSFTRIIEKLKEWIVAIKLERNFTKNEIITLYLNMVNYGDEIYGIRNASKTYFQKEPGQLKIEEAAVLVGILKGSTRYNPRRNPKSSMERRNTVLDQMVRNNYINQEEADQLKEIPIRLKYNKLNENSGIAPYFREVLRDEVKQWCAENENPKTGEPYDIYKDGLKIYTTINPKMQEYAELAVYRHMQKLQSVFSNQSNIKSGSVWETKEGKSIIESAIKKSERWSNLKEDGLNDEEIRQTFFEEVPMKIFAWNAKREIDTVMTPLDSIKYHKQIMQIGLLSIDPLSGDVKAWVGGSGFKKFKFDHVNKKTRRQVGSTFKPLLYTLAVTNGYTRESPMPSGPIKMGNKYIGGGGGPMAICLAYSKNPAAAYLINQMGVDRTIDFAKKCGIENSIPRFPSIALGAAQLSLYEMVRSFTMFPGSGLNVKPNLITRIEDRSGKILVSFRSQATEVINESEAYIMTQMLQGVVNFGTARELRGRFGINAKIAGKTGTTNDNTDGWFIGFSPELLTGVWVGCDDPYLKLLYTAGGSQMAMPAWAYYYQQVFDDKTLNISPEADFVTPPDMKTDPIFNYNETNIPKELLPAEGEEGYIEEDFIQIPISDGTEKPTTESKKFDEPPSPKPAPKKKTSSQDNQPMDIPRKKLL
jgi:penicillin-binding protein 1A